LQDIGYIGYRESKVGTTFVPIVVPTGEPTTTAIASVVATVGATIAASWDGWFSHPAADANNIIDKMKPLVTNLDAKTRMAYVIAASTKISARAKDVDAEKNLLWYRLAYPNDYTVLSPDDKNYWNNYLNNIRAGNRDGNNMYANLELAMFRPDEINYNATPITAASNILSNAGISTNTIIYVAIGIGLFLLIKK
jgi:hypothetical protein